jgi:hypothetical protein
VFAESELTRAFVARRNVRLVPAHKNNDKRARCPFSRNFTLHLNPVYPVHPCKFSHARRNVHSARHEARLSSSKRVNLVGLTVFSDEVFMLGKTTVRSAVSPNTGGAPILKSPVTEDCVQHGGHQPLGSRSSLWTFRRTGRSNDGKLKIPKFSNNFTFAKLIVAIIRCGFCAPVAQLDRALVF